MTSAASNYHESTSFIHQRYEDTALNIFNQQQKVRQDEKRRQQQSKAFHHPAFGLPQTDQHPEFSRYGNRAIVATETVTPTKPEAVKPVKTPEPKSLQPAVKSSSDTVDGGKPKRRSSSRRSQTVEIMELHPMLELETIPNPGLWYVLSGLGECPSMRVGESCSYVPGKHESDNGHLYIIGGANPSGPFCDTYVLDLNTFRWDFIDSPGFRARYEHASFTPESQPGKIYVFGGADQTGNMNDIQLLDTDTSTWSSVSTSGTPPTERTYHTSTAVVGDKFIVYGGGHCGSDPVTDRQVHAFDTKTHSWETLNIKGDSPKPRHGHVVVAVDNKIYIHGGMSGPNFYHDIHVLNLNKLCWSDVKRKKIYPSARAGHSGVAMGTNMFIFGGMNRDGALDETWKFDTLTSQWTKIELQGPAPGCRLDLGMCVIQLKRSLVTTDTTTDVVTATKQAKDVLDREMSKPGSASSRSSCPELGATDSSPNGASGGADSGSRADSCDDVDGALGATAPSSDIEKVFSLCLVHAGMDTEGEIFDDVLVINLDT